MSSKKHILVKLTLPILILATAANATSVPSLSFEELTDKSDLILTGSVSRSWAEWDAEHRFIWTHHEVVVSDIQKGSAGSTVVLSELGGVVGHYGMAVAGSAYYQPNDQVVVFLGRLPNGYLRTTGWAQGKYTVDTSGRLRPAMHGTESIQAENKGDGANTATRTSLHVLDGMTLSELHARIASRIKSQNTGRTK